MFQLGSAAPTSRFSLLLLLSGSQFLKSASAPLQREVRKTFRSPKLPRFLKSLILLIAAAGVAHGQSLTFAYAQSVVAASGLTNPRSVAVDGLGNTYIADFGNHRVVKLLAGGGAQTTVGTGLQGPSGVAVDGAGDVYISDATAGVVVEVAPAASGGAQTTVASNLNQPACVAVYGNNVYICDTGNNQIVEVSGPSPATSTPCPSPTAIAANGSGVFAATGNAVVEFTQNAGTGPLQGGSIPLATSLGPLSGLTLNAAGDLYIADTNNDQILELPFGGGTTVPVATNLAQAPGSLAMDSLGDFYYVAAGSSNQVVELQTTFVNFGAVSVGQAKTLTVNYNVAFNGASVGAATVLTDGVANLDYALVPGSNTCAGLSTVGPCTVKVTFTPKAPGLRKGSVQIAGLVGATFVSGTGVGPQIGFGPGVQTTVGSALVNPTASWWMRRGTCLSVTRRRGWWRFRLAEARQLRSRAGLWVMALPWTGRATYLSQMEAAWWKCRLTAHRRSI